MKLEFFKEKLSKVYNFLMGIGIPLLIVLIVIQHTVKSYFAKPSLFFMVLGVMWIIMATDWIFKGFKNLNKKE